MGLFHRRPLALGALLFMLSGALAYFTKLNLIFLIAAAATISVAATVCAVKKRKRLIPLTVIVGMLACAGFCRSYFYRLSCESALNELAEKTIEVTLSVGPKISSAAYRTSYEATLTSAGGRDTEIDVIFSVPYEDGLSPGTLLSTTVSFSDFSRDNAGFNEKAYYNSKGILLSAEQTEDTRYTVISENSNVNKLSLTAYRFRQRLMAKINLALPEKNGLPAAIFLGDRSGLSDADRLSFRRTGTYHLLSLSGMHLTVLSGILDFLLRSLGLKKGPRLAVSAAGIICYVILTGFALSVVRAAIMLLISYGSYYVRRENDPLTALTLAGALICAVSPEAISDVGFILSLATTFGIIAFYPAVAKEIIGARVGGFAGGALKYIFSSIIISLVALMTSLPVSWLYFGKLTVLSPPGTLVLSPMISAVMILTPLLIIFGTVPLLGPFLGYSTLWISKTASSVASYLAKPDRIELSLDYDFTAYFFIPFFILLLAIVFLKLSHLRLYVAAAAAIIVGFTVTHSVYVPLLPPETVITTLGENEYFIISGHGQNVLIDISDGSYKNLSAAAAEATSKGYCQLDAVVLTHYHKKHTSSISRLLQNNTVRQLVLSEPISEAEYNILMSVTELAKEKGIQTYVFKNQKGLTLFGDIRVTLDRDYIDRSTHPVLSLRFKGEDDISYFGSSYLEEREISDAGESLILGTHGPIAKKLYSLPITEKTSLISFADNATAELLSKDAPKPPEGCRVIIAPKRLRIGELSE